MQKAIIVSDSFKGTLSCNDIFSIWKEVIKERGLDIALECFPVADGGEGTVDAFFECLGGEIKEIESVDANGKRIKAKYLLKDSTAIIEVSSCVYLPTTTIKNPLITTSYGVGLLIKDAITRGAKKIIIGLGGSSTNDAGAPIAQALGARFFNANGEEISDLSGGNLNKVVAVDISNLNEAIRGVEFVGMCDVKNPLCGPFGASAVYGPQKGADEETVRILDKNLSSYSKVIGKEIGRDCSKEQGAGAAGGIGFGIVSLLNGKLVSGIDVLLDAIDFDKKLDNSDLVISGEGRLDIQSFYGKVIDGISKRCDKKNKELALIVGCLGKGVDYEEIRKRGIKEIEICSNGEVDFEEIRKNAHENYKKAVIRLIEKRLK
ncbi:MAG: glycerate kinase [Bacilli bacterium]|nr:glycerate kinase [Bacilli bacterium]